MAQAHPRSSWPATVAAQNRAPISSCMPDGCGHCAQPAASVVDPWSGAVFTDLVKNYLRLAPVGALPAACQDIGLRGTRALGQVDRFPGRSP